MEFAMNVHYLEIVASDVDAVCAAYEAAHGIKFGSADPLLGGARTAPLPAGGSIGVRGPLRDTEEPVVRPYWLVDDIEAALDAATRQAAVVAHSPLGIPGRGAFAIYIQGDVDHGLWQLCFPASLAPLWHGSRFFRSLGGSGIFSKRAVTLALDAAWRRRAPKRAIADR